MLERSALYYLQRFASSGANLRRVLMGKVERSVRQHGTDRTEAAAWVDRLIERLQKSGVLNDALYAENKAQSLLRRGNPRRLIARTLMAKGVAAPEIAAAIDATARDRTDPELAAAVAYARRRRLGPWREAAARASHRDRDLAAMARRGFSYDLAQRVIAADSPEALEAAVEA